MTILDHGQSADTSTRKHRTGLIAVLAILAVALLALGTWLVVNHQAGVDDQTKAAQQQQAEMLAVITANQQASNANDENGIWATITSDFRAYTSPEPSDFEKAYSVGGFSAEEYVDLVVHWGNWQENFIGEPVFSGDLEVTIPTRAESESDASPRVGSYRYTLREVDGQLKIASMIWTDER